MPTLRDWNGFEDDDSSHQYTTMATPRKESSQKRGAKPQYPLPPELEHQMAFDEQTMSNESPEIGLQRSMTKKMMRLRYLYIANQFSTISNPHLASHFNKVYKHQITYISRSDCSPTSHSRACITSLPSFWMGHGFLLGYLGHLVASSTRYVLVVNSFNFLFRTHHLFEAAFHIIDVLGNLLPL